MIVYRISHSRYSDDISGAGSKRYGSRWNSAGIPMLYTAEHISLAILEMLVNTQFKDYDVALDLMYIQFPPHPPASEIRAAKLKENWREDFEVTRFIGDEFINQKQNLLLKVPSAVVQEEYNYLANPLHSDFKKIKIIKTRSFWPDKLVQTVFKYLAGFLVRKFAFVYQNGFGAKIVLQVGRGADIGLDLGIEALQYGIA